MEKNSQKRKHRFKYSAVLWKRKEHIIVRVFF
jgi:hypothetical protein